MPRHEPERSTYEPERQAYELERRTLYRAISAYHQAIRVRTPLSLLSDACAIDFDDVFSSTTAVARLCWALVVPAISCRVSLAESGATGTTEEFTLYAAVFVELEIELGGERLVTIPARMHT